MTAVGNGKAAHVLADRGDFTAEIRLVWIAALAIGIGASCAFVAKALLWLIALFTNLFYYGQLSADPHNLPAGSPLGLLMIFVPVAGGLIIGVMARYGSDRIRGHGIPEAIEAILIGQSRMSPKVAVLKPLSSAVSIGSGGPFGAEGPIIMTGGAFGSIVAQVFRLSAAERKTLLVAGAAAGMAATFGTPVAAVLLAVELLLFEWKPRSLIPVALASAAAVLIRPHLLEPAPLFQTAAHAHPGAEEFLSAFVLGLVAGGLALLLTLAVYGMEDLFQHLPIHWMWWPALGGLAVGVGGYFQPHALGVGYDLIEGLLSGGIGQVLGVEPANVPWALLGLIVVKGVIWAVALGSGTSGGVLAPLLILGGSLGALAAPLLPGGDRQLWALVSVAAIMGGTMRSPLTGVLFALELTYDIRTLPILLIASVVAYLFTVLVMKRSILTEKVARRGYHISREYTVDPLERLSVAEVMTTAVETVPASLPVRELLTDYFLGGHGRPHQGYPVVDKEGDLVGVLTRSSLLETWIYAHVKSAAGTPQPTIDVIIAYDLIQREPITAFPWESCRTAAERMAQSGVGRLPVVSPEQPRKVIGMITRSDLLKPRARMVEEEVKRERFIAARRAGPTAPG